MRITKWNGNKYVLPQGKGSFREIAERLAAYENIGEPEEINKALNGEKPPKQDRAKEKRVFISGPITGTDDYMERFAAAEDHLRSEGYIPLNPTKFSKHLLEAEFNWGEFMDITLSLLRQCSGIYMLDGWEKSAGAKFEYQFALANNYQFIN